MLRIRLLSRVGVDLAEVLSFPYSDERSKFVEVCFGVKLSVDDCCLGGMRDGTLLSG